MEFAFFTHLYSPLQSHYPVFYFLLEFCGIAAAENQHVPADGGLWLCGGDFGGALISSKGKFDIEFFLHINLPAWKKLATEGFLAAKSGLRKMCTNPARIEQEIQQMIEKNHDFLS